VSGAEGEFTRTEIKEQQERVDTIKFRLTQLRNELTRRWECAQRGHAEKNARLIAEALKDADFRLAVQALDLANDSYTEAKRAWDRCSKTKVTKTGKARKRAFESAAKAVAGANAALAEADEGFGVMSTPSIKVPSYGSLYSHLKSVLRQLIRSFKEGDIPDQVVEAENELSEKERILNLMQEHSITGKKIGHFARYLEEKQRKVLVKLSCQGYVPQAKTLKKEKVYPALESLGLVELGSQWIKVLPLGHDVAHYIRDSMAGTRPDEGASPFSTHVELRECFTPEQIETMIEKAKALLIRVARGKAGKKPVECGIPKEGFSYKLVPEAKAVQWFLYVLGANKAPKKKTSDGPKVLRKKRPTHSPGRILPLTTSSRA